MKRPKVYKCKFVQVTDLVPEHWQTWFYEMMCGAGPPFTWGDNSRSMVTVSTFLRFVQPLLDELSDDDVCGSEVEKFLEVVRRVGAGVLIDLEN